jgi:hypothetical protein
MEQTSTGSGADEKIKYKLAMWGPDMVNTAGFYRPKAIA